MPQTLPALPILPLAGSEWFRLTKTLPALGVQRSLGVEEHRCVFHLVLPLVPPLPPRAIVSATLVHGTQGLLHRPLPRVRLLQSTACLTLPPLVPLTIPPSHCSHTGGIPPKSTHPLLPKHPSRTYGMIWRHRRRGGLTSSS